MRGSTISMESLKAKYESWLTLQNPNISSTDFHTMHILLKIKCGVLC